GNTADGIFLEAGSANNLIGGSGAAQRNVLSGNQGDGLHIDDFSSRNTAAGNYVGIAADGTAGNGMLGNEGQGIDIGGGASDNLIGAGNVISGNAGYGIGLFGSGNRVQGNLIGTGP